MSQTCSRDLALAGSTWDQILNNFYPDAVLSNIRHTQAGYALALEIDPVGTGFRLPLANLGLDSRDFKITGWLKIQEADHRDNEAVWCASSPQESTSLPPSYLQGGLRLTLSGERLDLNQIGLDSVEISSLCSREFIADGALHFFKIDRSPSDSSIRLSVDGNLAAQEMNSSPGIDYMEFDLHGWIDEVQVVDLSVDQLLVNYSFDEGIGIFTTESLRGQSVPLFQEGMLGSARWVLSDLFLHQLYLPILVR